MIEQDRSFKTAGDGTASSSLLFNDWRFNGVFKTYIKPANRSYCTVSSRPVLLILKIISLMLGVYILKIVLFYSLLETYFCYFEKVF